MQVIVNDNKRKPTFGFSFLQEFLTNSPLITILFILIFQMSCTSTERKEIKDNFKGLDLSGIDENIPITDIDSSNVTYINIQFGETRSIKIDDLLEEVKYIPLESGEDFYIGEIRNIKIHNDLIFVFDPYITKNIYCYNKDGTFKYKLMNRGEGPLEYINLSDFSFIPHKNQLVIYDDVSSKLIYCDLNNGKPIDYKKLTYRFQNLDYDPESGNYITSANNKENSHLPQVANYQLVMMDSNLNIKSKAIPQFINDNNDYSQDSHHKLTNRVVNYAPRYRNKIYRVTNKSLNLIYHLNFNEVEMDNSFYTSPSEEFFEELSKTKKFYFFGDYVEGDQFAFFELKSHKKYLPFIYDKNSQKSIFMSGIELDSKNPAFSFPIAYYQGYFYSFLEAYEVVSLLDNAEKNNFEIEEDLMRIFKQIKNEDDPILFKFKVKTDFGELASK